MNEKPIRAYVPKSNARVQKTNFGDILKLGFNAESLIDFIKQHTNDRGYINFDVMPRKETDQYGNSHSVVLNEWKKDNFKGEMQERPKSTTPPLTQSETDDVPF
jgi:hypothetical protein